METTLVPPAASNLLLAVPVKTASVPLKVTFDKSPRSSMKLPETYDTALTALPSSIVNWPRSTSNVPGPAPTVAPKKENVILSSVGDTLRKAKGAGPPPVGGTVWRVGD